MSYAEIEYKVRDTSWAMSELQSHPYYELYLLTDGSRELFCENKMFNVSAGMLSVIAPFAMHKTTGGSYKRINVYVSPDLLTERERALLERLSEGVALALGTEAYRHISELLTYGSDIRIVDHNEKTALKLAFIKAMMYILETDAPTSIASDASVPSETKDGHMLRIVSYVNEHYRDKLSLEIIGKRFFISKNSLSARFKKAMHCSVMEYVAFVRLSKAKELLSTTNKSIERIAELCGYSSSNYFSLTFKRLVGMSPKNYRKNI